jgi:hypothetical protein
VIDAEAGQSCNSNQQLLTWNQQGPQGPAGQDGSALAYANIEVDHVVATKSRGVTDANLAAAGNGHYCFGGLPFTPRNIVVTLGRPVGGSVAPVARAYIGDDDANIDQISCPVGYRRAAVQLYDPAGGPVGNQTLYVLFN